MAVSNTKAKAMRNVITILGRKCLGTIVVKDQLDLAKKKIELCRLTCHTYIYNKL